jgi:hypothetical protein
MQMKARARILAVVGVFTGGVGFGTAVYGGQPWAIAANAFMMTCTIVVGIFAWRITYR